MPQAPMSNSAGYAQPDNGATPNAAAAPGGAKAKQQGKQAVPAGKAGGEIVISRIESAALAAFETEPEARAMKRAQAESGLTPNQIRKLKARADRARKGGFTLKGANLVLKPTNHPEETEQHGLLRDMDGDGDVDLDDAGEDLKASKKPASKKAANDAKGASKKGADASKKAAKKPAASKTKEASVDAFDATVEEMVAKALGDETV